MREKDLRCRAGVGGHRLHLAYERVFEDPLARAREARHVLLHQDLGSHERLHYALGARHAEGLERGIPTRQTEHAQAPYRISAFFVQGVQAHLDGGFDRRRVRGVPIAADFEALTGGPGGEHA